jgi:O-antigen ligase
MRAASAVLLLALLTLPWLTPFAPGPSAAVGPLLFAWACVGALAWVGLGFEHGRGGGEGRADAATPGSENPQRNRRAWGWALAWAVVWVLAAVRPVALPGVDGAPADGAAAGVMWVGTAAQRWNTSPETLGLIAALLATGLCALCFAHAGPRARRALAGAWVLAAAVGALIGWLQYTGHAAAFWPWVNGARPGEAYGNLRQRNLYASGLAIGLAALLWWARQAPAVAGTGTGAGPGGSPLRTVGLAALAGLMGSALALSASRTGLVALGVLALLANVWRLWRAPGVAAVLGSAALAYGATAVLLPWLWPQWAAGGIFSRLAEGAPTCSSRLTLWRNVLYLIAERPWGGWGWGQLDAAHFLTLYPDARFCDILDNAHNLPLHWAVELGVPVALLLCGAALWAVWRARPWVEHDATRQLAWSVLAVMALHSLLEYPLWYGPFQMAAGAALGLLMGPLDLRRASRVRGCCRAAAVALGVAVGVAAVDYARVSQIYLAPQDRLAVFGDDALAAASRAWVFRDTARFAALTVTPLQAGNAAWVWATARDLLRYSPEPRVIEPLIESAERLGESAYAAWLERRYAAAFPADHAAWAARRDVVAAPASAPVAGP